MADKLSDSFTIRISPRFKVEIDELTERQKLLLNAEIRKTMAKIIHLCKFNPAEYGLNGNDTNFFE